MRPGVVIVYAPPDQQEILICEWLFQVPYTFSLGKKQLIPNPPLWHGRKENCTISLIPATDDQDGANSDLPNLSVAA